MANVCTNPFGVDRRADCPPTGGREVGTKHGKSRLMQVKQHGPRGRRLGGRATDPHTDPGEGPGPAVCALVP